MTIILLRMRFDAQYKILKVVVMGFFRILH